MDAETGAYFDERFADMKASAHQRFDAMDRRLDPLCEDGDLKPRWRGIRAFATEDQEESGRANLPSRYDWTIRVPADELSMIFAKLMESLR
ncbi:MAG: hypothetical protein OXC31_00505 [Spirochaetaceae bacterium]|nr:hypothetical protein [Spirochaetaceae bacterium]